MTMEELFTTEEMDEALQSILLDDGDREMYEGAPSDTLRKFYLMEKCFLLRGDGEGVDSIIDDIADMICRFEDSFTVEDWLYESAHTCRGWYKGACSRKVQEFVKDDVWKQECLADVQDISKDQEAGNG